MRPPDPWNGSGSDAGSGLGIGTAIGSAGSAIPPPEATIEVAISSKPPAAFELWEDGKRVVDPGNDVGDNVQMVNVVKGHPRDLVIKAHGYQDAKVTVTGDKNIVHVTLVRVQGQTPPPLHPPHPPNNVGNGSAGSGSKPTNPFEQNPKNDCSESIKNPRNHRCVAQYCAGHEHDPRCDLE